MGETEGIEENEEGGRVEIEAERVEAAIIIVAEAVELMVEVAGVAGVAGA
jgi:hypothetical protein